MTKSNGPYANPWWHHSNPREKRFLRDVESYQLSVLRDEGLDRHLKFKRTDAQPIHIVTWDGYLAITGPKGAWVFWKWFDMFKFFRSPRHPSNWNHNQDGGLSIDPFYWYEKLVSVSLRESSSAKARLPSRFIWSCYAIAWGIARYDEWKVQ
jgi:hypothetical protein